MFLVMGCDIISMANPMSMCIASDSNGVLLAFNLCQFYAIIQQSIDHITCSTICLCYTLGETSYYIIHVLTIYFLFFIFLSSRYFKFFSSQCSLHHCLALEYPLHVVARFSFAMCAIKLVIFSCYNYMTLYYKCWLVL